MWRWLRERSGVRVRSAAAAAGVVALALVLGAVALLLLLDRSQRSTAETAARQYLDGIVARVAQGDDPGAALENAGSPLALAQVLDDKRAVLAATAPLTGRPPLTGLRPPAGQTLVEELDAAATPVGEPLLIVAATVSSDRGAITVISAVSRADAASSIAVARSLVLIGGPLLILVAALSTYAFAGRALRPVEAIRARVAGLTEHDLDQRVPVPQARDEVSRLAETMNDMLARLQAAQASQRQFVADASHELRSPLATITAGLELIDRQAGGTYTVAAMRADAARLAQLVADLLLLARADERGLTPGRDDVDLDELMDAERARLASTTAAVVSADVTPVRVIGDRTQLARMLRNLVDNAVQHANDRIILRLRRDAGSAVVEVADDGPGIAAADRDRVFRRFVRLDPGRTRPGGGAGLGLSIVAEVVAAHGGRVEIADAPGGGTLVRVWLPAAPGVHGPDS